MVIKIAYPICINDYHDINIPVDTKLHRWDFCNECKNTSTIGIAEGKLIINERMFDCDAKMAQRIYVTNFTRKKLMGSFGELPYDY